MIDKIRIKYMTRKPHMTWWYIHMIFILMIFLFLQLLSPQLIQAIKPAIGDQWTPAVEQAWINFLLYITGIMKNAMLQATWLDVFVS